MQASSWEGSALTSSSAARTPGDDRTDVTPSAQITSTPRKTRVEWVDIAKGLTIVLVVLLHVVDMLVRRDMTPEVWRTINGYLQPVRMPLFFVASGLFAQGMIAMAWPTMLRSRVAHLFYLYMLWLVVFFAVHNVLPQEVSHGGYASWQNIVGGIYMPNSALWFIYGLAVFAVAAKLMSKLPLWVQFSAAIALSVFSQYYTIVHWSWNNLAEYFVYFLLGLHARSVIIKVSNRNSVPWVLAAIAAYAAVFAVLRGTSIDVPGMKIVLTTFGLLAGVLVASALVRTWLGEMLNKVGRNTLPVYLMLDILIAVLVFGLMKTPIVGGLVVVQFIAPVVLTVATVMLALYVHKALMAARLTWLFELPPKLRGTASTSTATTSTAAKSTATKS
ncbi:acyltransferase family protein [Hoyosella rhizosphaerae]|uniref:Acyltransferase n=1 Tax=Hoyosella rhizosphaerae TaxID=1755582 RepID=A0A916U9F2_9ACTN|nr:acyltransferase family protein [Hoyosella rhizosphaerae]MBN4927634.1 acyltransferase family protein [Hoyosella rhizosphaerae]GGC62915.1 acyltransferase [Hoyosella rhizosphaerae]